jgi:hypothetical protein
LLAAPQTSLCAANLKPIERDYSMYGVLITSELATDDDNRFKGVEREDRHYSLLERLKSYEKQQRVFTTAVLQPPHHPTDDGFPFAAIVYLQNSNLLLPVSNHPLFAPWDVGTATYVGILQQLRRFGFVVLEIPRRRHHGGARSLHLYSPQSRELFEGTYRFQGSNYIEFNAFRS